MPGCSKDGCAKGAIVAVWIRALDGIGELHLCEDHVKEFNDAFGDDPAVDIIVLPQDAAEAAPPSSRTRTSQEAEPSRSPEPKEQRR